MTQAATISDFPLAAGDDAASRRMFAAAALALAGTAALLAGWVPIGFSIVTVFLFAGPHNWLEFRYFVSRMPARWGPLTAYFSTAIAGVVLLTAGFAALPWLAEYFDWEDDTWMTALAGWNSALVLWVAVLIAMRGKQVRGRDWTWAVPVGFALVAGVWMAPRWWSIGLVYLHPLMALWFLDRELARSRPQWLSAYRTCVAAVPLLLLALWLRLGRSPDLPGEDILTGQITRHAGAGILQGVSTHFLVSAHTFLEMLHYGVWLIAIPLVGLRVAPWRIEATPLGRRSPIWRTALRGVFVLGGVAVLTLWACFLADYSTTRDVYFTVALAHVLSEAPFLLRML